jgi:hypothetical protein
MILRCLPVAFAAAPVLINEGQSSVRRSTFPLERAHDHGTETSDVGSYA